MDVNIDCYYYIKEVEDKNHKKYNVFCIKNIPLNEKIIKEMEKYSIVEFADNFNQSLCDNLPSKIKEIIFGNKFNHSLDNLPIGLKCLTLSKNYDKPLNNLRTSVKIIRK